MGRRVDEEEAGNTAATLKQSTLIPSVEANSAAQELLLKVPARGVEKRLVGVAGLGSVNHQEEIGGREDDSGVEGVVRFLIFVVIIQVGIEGDANGQQDEFQSGDAIMVEDIGAVARDVAEGGREAPEWKGIRGGIPSQIRGRNWRPPSIDGLTGVGSLGGGQLDKSQCAVAMIVFDRQIESLMTRSGNGVESGASGEKDPQAVNVAVAGGEMKSQPAIGLGKVRKSAVIQEK